MSDTSKRPAGDGSQKHPAKKQKQLNLYKKQQRFKGAPVKATIESGDSGIFVTCDRGREGKCVKEIVDLLSQEVEPAPSESNEEEESAGSDDGDIEAQIRKEVEGMHPATLRPKFQNVKLDIPCVCFIKFGQDCGVDPVKIVHQLCMDARTNPEKKRSRWVQRLTPVTLVRKFLGDGLEEMSREVLKPHFHSGGPPKKYAIRPTVRNNNKWNRDAVIKLVANIVGPEHPVNLKNYDLLILVDVFQNFCGMSVVGSDYESLKRYNLAELYNPTFKPQASKEQAKATEESSK